ncbi:hypothetical protein VE03_07913 [Pseudogymnoascus sp. 23342-1-I1]|nr:hypothetical protein VE03_07913 [Pseudogymnoascus sp. 23342-1-I1]
MLCEMLCDNAKNSDSYKTKTAFQHPQTQASSEHATGYPDTTDGNKSNFCLRNLADSLPTLLPSTNGSVTDIPAPARPPPGPFSGAAPQGSTLHNSGVPPPPGAADTRTPSGIISGSSDDSMMALDPIPTFGPEEDGPCPLVSSFGSVAPAGFGMGFQPMDEDPLQVEVMDNLWDGNPARTDERPRPALT